MVYLDKDFEEVAVNFVEIKTLCTKYYTTFPSKSKLYNHLKNSYLQVASPFFSVQADFYHYL